MKLPSRRIRLALLLVVAALAAVASAGPERAAAPDAPNEGAGPVPASVGGRPAPEPTVRAPVADVDAPGRAFQVQAMTESSDAFQPRDWRPPPPPKPATPVKPVAPPLPFAYLGRIEEDGVTTVYLRRGEDVVLAQPQKSIDANYRLEEAVADRLVFVYLPLKQEQVLSLGAAR